MFVFWRRLKEDYSSDIIFQTATAILVGMGLGLLMSKLFLPLWFFWLALAGSLAGMLLMVSKFKLKKFETFEAFVLASLPAISVMLFEDSIIHSTLSSFLAFVASLVFIFIAYWIDQNYKSFTWYKSGKIGFTGLSTSALFFLVRTVVAITGISVVSFVGRFEAIGSGIIGLVCLGLLIYLGREKV